MTIRVLVVDDSPFIRRILTDWLSAEAGIEVVGTAANGDEAVAKAKELRPDLITLDVEMPGHNGIWALEQIMGSNPIPTLMVSSVTTQGAELTLKALELGAYDFVTKPQGSSSFKFLGTKDELIAKVYQAPTAKCIKRATIVRAKSAGVTDKVVLMASSTGGPKALTSVFESLPEGFSAPILMVQHMPAGFIKTLATRLSSLGHVQVREAEPGDKMSAGVALIAPAGQHMTVNSDGSLHFNSDDTLHGVRPAADYLFTSAARAFKSRCLGVVLTGMGRDGAEGAKSIHDVGGRVITEHESTCTIFGMPKATKELGIVDGEFPIHEIGHAIVASLSGRLARAS